jgi:hypothetical protein
MKQEQPPRRRAIVSAVVATAGIEVSTYDAARRCPTERQARAACLSALMADLADDADEIRVVIEQDDTLIASDRKLLYRAAREAGRGDTIHYEHSTAHAEPLLALPDVLAWCWARSGDWRRRITPILTATRTV